MGRGGLGVWVGGRGIGLCRCLSHSLFGVSRSHRERAADLMPVCFMRESILMKDRAWLLGVCVFYWEIGALPVPESADVRCVQLPQGAGCPVCFMRVFFSFLLFLFLFLFKCYHIDGTCTTILLCDVAVASLFFFFLFWLLLLSF